MTEQFEYRVCSMQNGRVTFVNGEWQGTVSPTTENPNEALETCPPVWEYLRQAGLEGWELVTAYNQGMDDTQLQTLFLKRSRSQDSGA